MGQGVAKSQTRLTVMIILMGGTFMVAWLPYAFVSVIAMAGGAYLLTPLASAAPAIVAKSSLIYNPIIYALMNPQVC